MLQAQHTVVPPVDNLPLAARYQSAWSEHGARVAQRQAVIQMYLTAAGVIYGFWFTSSKLGINTFLITSITLLTVCSSALIWTNNRVMRQLSHFLRHCERHAAESEKPGPASNLYFFYDETTGVRAFHLQHKWLHRSVISLILLATNLIAIVITWNKTPAVVSGISIAALSLAILLLLKDVFGDW